MKTKIVPVLLLLLLLTCAVALYAEVTGSCVHVCTDYEYDNIVAGGYGSVSAGASAFQDSPIPDGVSVQVSLSWGCPLDYGSVFIQRTERWTTDEVSGGAQVGLLWGVVDLYNNAYPIVSVERGGLIGAGTSEVIVTPYASNWAEWVGGCHLNWE